ncbi:MAG: D-glycerate dehydrogenase [Thermoleophilia bacterium]|nr:D-glycerate dehydrogenase [Thermoleophilia bacterium]
MPQWLQPEAAALLRDAGLDVADGGRGVDDDPLPRAGTLALVEGCAGVLTQLADRVDDAFLDAAGPGLRVVANVAVGHDNVDVGACSRRGVVVTNTPGVLTDATADLALALILMATRRLGDAERRVRTGEPWRWGMGRNLGTGLQGRTLGIVGLGQIGAATARRARALGMHIAYAGRRDADPAVVRELGARRLPLHDLLAACDVVSLHCPLTPETRHLVDARALARMRPDAFLVNTARGPVVDEAALADALRAGALAGAALDVYEDEPRIHPGLAGRDDVVLLPHVGSATRETRRAMALLAARNAAAVIAGERPLTPVG